MLTPFFRLTQDAESLTIIIRAPHCSLRQAELCYGERSFLFSARPYFLRLFLPAEVLPSDGLDGGEMVDGLANPGGCEYDVDKGLFTIRMPKANKGEHFPGLEMLSELLGMRPPQQSTPSAQRPVELLEKTIRDDDEKDGGGGLSREEEDDGEDVGVAPLTNDGEDGSLGHCTDDLYANQQLVHEEEGVDEATYLKNGRCARDSHAGYGFGWLRHDVLGRLLVDDDVRGLIDLPADPEATSIPERSNLLRLFDEEHFSADYYLADLFEPDETMAEALRFSLIPGEHLSLTDTDLTDLKDLRRRQLESLTDERTWQVALSLVDLLFAYSYDLRATASVESSWTIEKLAPTLTFLVRWDTVKEAMVAAVRRSLCYPLFRNWALSCKVLDDVLMILKSGRSAILHALLVIRRLFNRGTEFRYLFNQLFIDDYCLWIQSVSEGILVLLTTELAAEMARLTKGDVDGLEDLEVLEMDARLHMLAVAGTDAEEKVVGNGEKGISRTHVTVLNVNQENAVANSETAADGKCPATSAGGALPVVDSDDDDEQQK